MRLIRIFSYAPLALVVVLLMALGLSLLPARPARSAPPTLADERVLVLGDSITQAGDYVTFLEYYLDKAYPDQAFDIVSVGLASETASGLSEKAHPFPRPNVHERLWAALDVVKPDIVIACYGMNDGIYHPQSKERQHAFQLGIEKLLAESKAAGAHVMLLTPPPFEATSTKRVRPESAPDFSYAAPFDGYDGVLADYAAWEQTLTSDVVTVVDLHAEVSAFTSDRRKTEPAYHMTGDGIHPDELGHLVIARSILKALGVPLDLSDIDAARTRAKADPIYPLVRDRRQLRSAAWLPYIGYTRDKVFKTHSVDEAEAKAAELQKKIDTIRRQKT